MADPQWDLQVAMSFLEGIEERFLALLDADKFVADYRATDMLGKGDYLLALHRVESAEAQGADGTPARWVAKELEGRICLAVHTSDDKETQRWRLRACQALTDAVQLWPTPMGWFRLGMAHVELKSTEHAITCFTKTEELADGDLKLDAAKMLDRCRVKG